MPANTIYVGRPTKYGNPVNWKDGVDEGYSESSAKYLAKKFYKDWLLGLEKFNTKAVPPTIEDIKQELKGKNLACFCNENQDCHADILLSIANS